MIRSFTMRGIRYERGRLFHPETPEDALQLQHMQLIERIRPPGKDEKEGKTHGDH